MKRNPNMTERRRQTLKASMSGTATAPSCLITPTPCPLCCSWSSEQHCSISIRWSLPPRLRPLCLWKWYSTGMLPACQDVTVFPHHLHLRACSSEFVCECVWKWGWYNWLTLFIITWHVFEVEPCASEHETSIFRSFCVSREFVVAFSFSVSGNGDVDCMKVHLLPFLPNPTPKESFSEPNDSCHHYPTPNPHHHGISSVYHYKNPPHILAFFFSFSHPHI